MLKSGDLKVITVREIKTATGYVLLIVLNNGIRVTLKLNLKAEILSRESFTIVRIESSPIESSLKAFNDKNRIWKPLMAGDNVNNMTILSP